LLPVVTYLTLKLKGVPFYEQRLFAKGYMSRKEFNASIRRVCHHYPDYRLRDKKEVVNRFILVTADYFSFPRECLEWTTQAQEHYWGFIGHRKEQVISAALISLYVLLIGDATSIARLVSISEYLGVSYGALHKPIKILLSLHGSTDVKGLVRAKEALRKHLAIS